MPETVLMFYMVQDDTVWISAMKEEHASELAPDMMDSVICFFADPKIVTL